MEVLTRTRRIGGSLIITIPKEIVREESLKEDELVGIKIEKIKKSGFGILKGMRSFSKEDELDTEL